MQREISKFLEEIHVVIPCAGSVDLSATIPTLQLRDLFVYIYPPYTIRQPNVTDFQTIHLDMDVLIASRQKIINRLKGMLGLGPKVYARNTVVARIDKRIAMEFQEEHHLQVPLPGKYRYGLYHQGELVSLAVFSGGRRMTDEPSDYRSFELLRFCHKGAYMVVGGVSKLIRQFAIDFQPGDIMTYADLDWCQQSSLEKIGFRPMAIKSPQTFYVENGSRNYTAKGEKGEYSVQNSGSLKLKLIL